MCKEMTTKHACRRCATGPRVLRASRATQLPSQVQARRRGVVCFTCDRVLTVAQAAAEAGETGVAELATPAVKRQDAAGAALQATGGNQARPSQPACINQVACSGLCEVQGGWPSLSSCWPPLQA